MFSSVHRFLFLARTDDTNPLCDCSQPLTAAPTDDANNRTELRSVIH